MNKLAEIKDNLHQFELEAFDELRAEQYLKELNPNPNSIIKDTDKGLRKNEGKIRMDLLEPFAIEQVAKIFTKGAEKYAPHNWMRGMKWSKMVASLKRHLSAFEQGQDYDIDPNCEGCKTGNCKNHTGEMHIAQVAWNALGLTSYYKYYPQGDDRLKNVLEEPRVGLDIDEVLCDWIGPWCEKFGYCTPNDWDFSYNNKKHFFEDMNKEELEEFYLNLPARISPSDIPFAVDCYITSRSVPLELTQKWLQKHGFPTKPVYSVGFGISKVDAVKEAGITHFIDDNYKTYLELNKNGIACFLMDANHNRKYNVGYKRVKSLKDFADRFLW